ncbi:MAG: hypothetical protein ACTSQE_08670 [Candidatus Heimdallarchaeaceae archaeon]
MSLEEEIKGRCVFHYKNEAKEKCSECNLPICDLDQMYNFKQERICPICANRYNAKKILRLFNYGLYGIIIIASVLILVVFKLGFSYLLVPMLLLLVAPYIFRPFLLRYYFRGLEPTQVVLPLLKYYEVSSNFEYFQMFLQKVEALSPEELDSMKDVILQHLIPALAFNFSKLPENWEDIIVEKLNLTKEEFNKILITKYRKVMIQTAVHAAQPNISKFMFYLAEETEDKDFLKEYIQEICSDELLELDDKELNSIYKDLLEELYLFEDDFYSICDELNLKEEKEKLKRLAERFVPPPVPRNQIEAVLPPEQLQKKREMEELQQQKVTEKEIEEIAFEEE